MKKFLIKLLLNLIPVRDWRRTLRTKINRDNLFGNLDEVFREIKVKKQTVLDNAKNCETIMLGSSHGAYGLNPIFISDKCYNLCTNSLDLYTISKIIFYYKEKLPNLKNIFLLIDVFSRGWCLEKSSAEHICASYKSVYGIEYPLYKDTKRYLKQCSKLDKLKYCNLKNDNGYLYPPKIDFYGSVKERVDGHLKEHDRSISQYHYITEISELGLNIVLIFPPLRKDYENFLKPNFLFDSIKDLEIKNNVRILDFTSDKDFCNDDFYDCDHLNTIGAEKLSKKIKELLF